MQVCTALARLLALRPLLTCLPACGVWAPAGHAHLDITERAGWRPLVVRRPVPREGPGVVWAPSPQALLHAVPAGLATNFG